jgi:hypothetical protein
MLGYLADIRQWATGTKYKGLRVQQTVVYVGSRRWAPATQIREEGLRFDYDFVDAKTLDPEPLLASTNFGDVTFAVLCPAGGRRGFLLLADRRRTITSAAQLRTVSPTRRRRSEADDPAVSGEVYYSAKVGDALLGDVLCSSAQSGGH